jgi:hypothetical protein
MKKTLAIVAIVGVAFGALAQGKVGFSNNSDRLIRWTTDTGGLGAGELAKAGLAVTSSDLQLKAQLFYNTASGSGAPVAEGALVAFGSPITLTFSTAGLLPGTSMTLNSPAVAGGAFGSFQIRVWEGSYLDYAAAFGAGYTGKSPVFTASPGAITPNQLYVSTSPTSSTWAAEEKKKERKKITKNKKK